VARFVFVNVSKWSGRGTHAHDTQKPAGDFLHKFPQQREPKQAY